MLGPLPEDDVLQISCPHSLPKSLNASGIPDSLVFGILGIQEKKNTHEVDAYDFSPLSVITHSSPCSAQDCVHTKKQYRVKLGSSNPDSHAPGDYAEFGTDLKDVLSPFC